MRYWRLSWNRTRKNWKDACWRYTIRFLKKIDGDTQRLKRRNSGTAESSMSPTSSAVIQTQSAMGSAILSNYLWTKRPVVSEKKGGRIKASIAHPGLVDAVAARVADHTAGSPVDAGVVWTNRSPRVITAELRRDGFKICPDTVRSILTEDLGLSVRQAVKDQVTCHFSQRNEQFEHIARLRQYYECRGWPVLSIDTKKKELLGNFFRPGFAYTNGSVQVLDHDFATHGHGRMVPYGVYDVVRNEGLMLLSVGSDSSALASDAIWRWSERLGWQHYEGAPRMLLLCDCGGSNGYRQLLFKEELHWLADSLEMSIRVAHYPPGCSKYNPIEHRMFCHVTRALKGVILQSLETAKRFIARTVTATGLRVVAEVTREHYQKGLKASAEFINAMPIRFHNFLPNLNYTLSP